MRYKPKRVAKEKNVIVKKNYPFAVRQKIVELRYGGIYGRRAPIEMEVPKIAQRLHMKVQTVYTILRTYRLDNYQLIKNPKAKVKKSFFKRHELNYLLENKTLKQLQVRNLKQRCEWIM